MTLIDIPETAMWSLTVGDHASLHFTREQAQRRLDELKAYDDDLDVESALIVRGEIDMRFARKIDIEDTLATLREPLEERWQFDPSDSIQKMLGFDTPEEVARVGLAAHNSHQRRLLASRLYALRVAQDITIEHVAQQQHATIETIKSIEHDLNCTTYELLLYCQSIGAKLDFGVSLAEGVDVR